LGIGDCERIATESPIPHIKQTTNTGLEETISQLKYNIFIVYNPKKLKKYNLKILIFVNTPLSFKIKRLN
jgi:hypothetical protein